MHEEHMSQHPLEEVLVTNRLIDITDIFFTSSPQEYLKTMQSMFLDGIDRIPIIAIWNDGAKDSLKMYALVSDEDNRDHRVLARLIEEKTGASVDDAIAFTTALERFPSDINVTRGFSATKYSVQVIVAGKKYRHELQDGSDTFQRPLNQLGVETIQKSLGNLGEVVRSAS